ncbi:unnamed protein product [Cuscuta campestris]|uniref:Uncharacterized protein n=1 Tax=Cuscuta campestris TaxID=132261 RepID=A0A484KDR7_9ASTE|nr:unnamed protein product [Cuscuta campestris]
MTDISEVGEEEFENAVEMMMEKDRFKDCLDYIETKIDQHVVLNNTYLFDTKLNCLYELDRKMDAFMEAKAYRADYRPLTHTVCVALGNGYLEEADYIEAYFYFRQFPSKQSVILSRLATELEKQTKRKLCEEKYEECLDYINKIDQDVVFSNVEIFDCKLKCLMKLDQKKKAIKEAQAYLGSGGVLSYFSCEILGSSYASKGNYDEACKHYLQAMKLCPTREEKTRYRSLLNSMEKNEERRKVREEDKRVARIDPSFLKGEIKRDDKKFTMSSKKKKKDGMCVKESR